MNKFQNWQYIFITSFRRMHCEYLFGNYANYGLKIATQNESNACLTCTKGMTPSTRDSKQEANVRVLSCVCYNRYYWLRSLAKPMVLTVTKCLKFGFAMDGRVCTPKRVKDILSSFLHGVIPEDVPQQR